MVLSIIGFGLHDFMNYAVLNWLNIQIDPLQLVADHKARTQQVQGHSIISLPLLISQPPINDRTHGDPHYFVLPHKNSTITGAFVYPPGGGQGWHTNSNLPGIRVYAAWSENGNSGMVFYENGEIRVDRDKPGWNVRAFKVPCWHAVWAECWRISIGFNVAGDK